MLSQNKKQKEKIYCKKCKQRLYEKTLLNKGTPMYEFEDGFYCHPCGKVKVEEARK